MAADKPYAQGEKQMSPGMREFLPFDANEPFHTVLFEQYGKSSEEIIEQFLTSEDFATDNGLKDSIGDYIYNELFDTLEEKGFITQKGDEYVSTATTKFLNSAIDRAGIVNVIQPEYDQDMRSMGEDLRPQLDILSYYAKKLDFIYTIGEYLGEQIDQKRAFEESRQETVIVPPLFDESFFSRDR